jgi:transposase
MWVPPEEKDPVLLHAPSHKSMALFGAVQLRRGRLVTLMTPVFDGSSFEVFLRLLLRHRSSSRRMVAILDNASYHHAVENTDFVRLHRDSLRLDFLPAYSPELNPIERVWKLLRRLRVHNRYFATLELLIEAVSEQLIIWDKPNAVLTRLCCIT